MTGGSHERPRRGARERVASIHPVAEKGCSRKLNPSTPKWLPLHKRVVSSTAAPVYYETLYGRSVRVQVPGLRVPPHALAHTFYRLPTRLLQLAFLALHVQGYGFGFGLGLLPAVIFSRRLSTFTHFAYLIFSGGGTYLGLIHRTSDKASSRSFKGNETRLQALPLWHPLALAQGKALERSRRPLPLQPPRRKEDPHKHSLSKPSSWGALL